jgi:integrase
MVWTPAQTRVFLARARRHRLYALYHLIAFRGLRRGEGCGLRRPDTDLDSATKTIRLQITQLGWATERGPPKSAAGERQVALDARTVAVIRAHRQHQDQQHPVCSGPAAGPDFEFTSPDGTPLHPAAVIRRVRAACLPCWPAPDPAARPEAWRCHAPARGRAPHEGRPGNPRPVLHHHRRRHLHLRAPRTGPPLRRRRRCTNPAWQAPASPPDPRRSSGFCVTLV